MTDEEGSPAGAGMTREGEKVWTAIHGFPRRCGDDPKGSIPSHMVYRVPPQVRG